MPIKWSAKKVIEATDEMEKYMQTIVEPLMAAREIGKQALQIPHLPDYMKSRFLALIGDIEHIVGDPSSQYGGTLRNRLKLIHDDVPADALKADEKNYQYGTTLHIL